MLDILLQMFRIFSFIFTTFFVYLNLILCSLISEVDWSFFLSCFALLFICSCSISHRRPPAASNEKIMCVSFFVASLRGCFKPITARPLNRRVSGLAINSLMRRLLDASISILGYMHFWTKSVNGCYFATHVLRLRGTLFSFSIITSWPYSPIRSYTYLFQFSLKKDKVFV